MSVLDTLTNNTILMPYHDSLVDSNPLPEVPIAKKIQEFNNNFEGSQYAESKQFQLYIASGGKSVPVGLCGAVEGLIVTRQVEEIRSGGNGQYLVKLPGPLSFGNVMIRHMYCDNDLFMNWMINGVNQGGIQRADVELRLGTEDDYMVYTLRDAFPVEWHLGTFSVDLEGKFRSRETLLYTIDADQLLVENVRIAYGRIDYEHVK